jgi:hypothetical protein
LQSQNLTGLPSAGARQIEVMPPGQDDRYRDLVEHAEDVILTCAPDGVMTIARYLGPPRSGACPQNERAALSKVV